MTQQNSLSDAALRYVATLTDQDARNDATGWARMDPMEFQARMGPFADSVEPKLDLILERQTLKGQVRAAIGLLGIAALGAWEFIVRRGGDLPR